MKKKGLFLIVFVCIASLFSFASCTFPRMPMHTPEHEHVYEEEWNYDDGYHWYACTKENCSARLAESAHTDSEEKILREASEELAGLAEYTCSVCGHIYQKTIYLETEILSLPTVVEEKIYIGQKLSSFTLSGGEGSTLGSFSWTDPKQTVSESGYYGVTFTPTKNDLFATVTGEIWLEAEQLTVTVIVGENGSASVEGVLNVDYGETLTIGFTPDTGYRVATLTVDGESALAVETCTLRSVVSNRVISVTFEQIPITASYTITYVSGSRNAYSVEGNTITFTEIQAETVYAISGSFDGNIVIDVGENYKFDLELTNFTLSCDTVNPITVLSGDEVSLTAKSGTENYIYDNRSAIDETDTTLYSASVYSVVDLEICGKGSLALVSTNNNGIHTKDDLQVKNLTLYVKCVDNALKGNDGVEITNANTTLIATKGDCIKTTNSHINETTLNQKGTVSVSGGTHNLYSACDGIDSAYNVVIDDASTVLNIYTDQYSEYSEEVTAVSESVYYLRYTSTSYKYSVKYYNDDTDYLWVNVSDSYETVTSSSNRPGGSGTTYYYYTFAKKTGYAKLAVYMYSASQEQGQDNDYYACSEYKTVNTSNDTVALSYRQSTLSVSWTNYTTSSSGGMGGMGGMEEGNTDKGTYSTKGIKSANEITINAGTISIQSYDDGIHANNDGGTLQNGETPTGNVTINGGMITVYGHDDGLHADGTLLITAGSVSVTKSYEGIEGAFIIIQGGNVSVVSSDDGFNGTSTSGASIEISGGTVYIYACGDGIDSNSTTSKGAIFFSGGKVVVICKSNGNSAIDSDGGYTHSAGTVLAVMASGGMTSESTNGNTTGRTTASVSLTSGNYLTVSVSGTVVVGVKMPCSMSAYAVYLGSSSATLSSASSITGTIDGNGVYWQS